jgi:hypothetical protein
MCENAKIKKATRTIFPEARNLTPLRPFVSLKEALRNFYSIAQARLDVFYTARLLTDINDLEFSHCKIAWHSRRRRLVESVETPIPGLPGGLVFRTSLLPVDHVLLSGNADFIIRR